MEIIKTLALAGMFLLTLTAGNCFVFGNFNSSDDDDDNDGLTIVVTNAEFTSSEVVQSLNQMLTVAEIASQSTQFINDTYSSNLLKVACDNLNGTINLMVNDEDNSNSISIGDELFLSYMNCNVNDVVANGNLEISVLDASGIDIGRFDSGTDWISVLSVNATSLQVATENNVMVVNGGLEITLEYEAASAMLKSKILNNTLTLDSETKRILSGMEISQVINLAVVPTNYSLIIDSLVLYSDALNGKINVTKSTEPFSGMELMGLDEYFVDLRTPENGVLKIIGKNSAAEVSVLSGEQVSIKVDSDGDSVLESEVFTTWREMHL